MMISHSDLKGRINGPEYAQRPTHSLEAGGELAELPLTVQLGPTLGALLYEDDEALQSAAADKAARVRDMIEKQGWSVSLRRNQPAYVKVEGWTALGALCGLVPTIVETGAMDNGARTAVAELRDATGRVMVRADAECGDELDGRWAREPGYSKRSMAQTRAISKVCRASLSWVMTLAGYAPTPAEEVMGRDFAEDTGLAGRLKSCITVMRAEAESIAMLREGLVSEDEEKRREAATAWFELDDEAKRALWIAPRDGGPFTTAERGMLKSAEFRQLYYGGDE